MKKNIINIKGNKSIRNKSYVLATLMLLAFIMPACRKFVTIENPPTILTADKVFADDKSATSAILSIYIDMMNDQFGSNGSFVCYSMSQLGGLSANELIMTGSNTTTPTYQEFSDHALTPPNSYVAALWKDGYKYIYRANAILENIATSTGMTPLGKQQIEGEARFMRGFCYFYLVNLFGDVPLVLGTDYHDNMLLARTPSSVVWDQVISDLKQAKALLQDAYITAERLRPNRATVSALLSRAYLYTGKWSEAETEANTIITSGVYGTGLPTLDKVFKKDSPETIWQLQPVRANTNTNEGASFLVTGTTQPGFQLTPQLLAAFEPNDNRKTQWVGFSNPAYPAWAFPAKYKAGAVATVTEYYIMFRLTEQYLIRSEARAHLDLSKLPSAITDLNVVRSRAGLPAKTPADQAALLLAIEQERRVEFFAEWGQRWLDLKRTNRASALLTPWKTGAELYPIPGTEMGNNPALKQNPGY